MIDKTVTIECIHNPQNGNLISTAIWKGFNLYDLLDNLGLKDEATGVKYTCADGYYTTHGIEEVRENGVLGALFMNQEPIPLKYGFPLRFINPGFYGVKNPGWVTAIEVLVDEIPDYWTTNGWKTTTPIGVDTKIFFPLGETKVSVGDTVKIGGAAYGGKRINKVEYSADGGSTWTSAQIKRTADEDYVWVFWDAQFIPREQGLLNLEFRTTNSQGDVQPREDPYFRDGTNSRPMVYLKVLQKR